MDLDFNGMVSGVDPRGDHNASTHDIWNYVFTLNFEDEDYVWNERLNKALTRFRVLTDDTYNGAILFGESAAHLYNANANANLVAQMARFRGLFIQINADARQAFNDNLGLPGMPNN